MYVYTGVHAHMCEGQWLTLGVFLTSLHLIFFFNVSHWTWSSLVLLEQLVSEQERSFHLCLPSPGIRNVCCHIRLFLRHISAGDPNSGPLVYMASNIINWPISPAPESTL